MNKDAQECPRAAFRVMARGICITGIQEWGNGQNLARLEVGGTWGAIDYNGFDRSGVGQNWTVRPNSGVEPLIFANKR